MTGCFMVRSGVACVRMSVTMTALYDLYPALAKVHPRIEDLGAQAGPMPVKTGMVLFQEHAPCMGFPLVLEGEVKVSRSSGDGRELELYRVSAGEFCLVSAACLFNAEPMLARGVASKPGQLLMVDPQSFNAWLADPDFRQAVFALFAQRMVDLTELIDAIAFRRLDVRLAAALLGHGPERVMTHQALADELGTVREMVTRLLRRFEREGWVELGREKILIRDSAALRHLAAQSSGASA